jgi:hypothetical protein
MPAHAGIHDFYTIDKKVFSVPSPKITFTNIRLLKIQRGNASREASLFRLFLFLNRRLGG